MKSRWEKRREREEQECQVNYGLTSAEMSKLATYNAEKARGIKHHPLYEEHMDELQTVFNEYAGRRGEIVVGSATSASDTAYFGGMFTCKCGRLRMDTETMVQCFRCAYTVRFQIPTVASDPCTKCDELREQGKDEHEVSARHRFYHEDNSHLWRSVGRRKEDPEEAFRQSDESLVKPPPYDGPATAEHTHAVCTMCRHEQHTKNWCEKCGHRTTWDSEEDWKSKALVLLREAQDEIAQLDGEAGVVYADLKAFLAADGPGDDVPPEQIDTWHALGEEAMQSTPNGPCGDCGKPHQPWVPCVEEGGGEQRGSRLGPDRAGEATGARSPLPSSSDPGHTGQGQPIRPPLARCEHGVSPLEAICAYCAQDDNTRRSASDASLEEVADPVSPPSTGKVAAPDAGSGESGSLVRVGSSPTTGSASSSDVVHAWEAGVEFEATDAEADAFFTALADFVHEPRFGYLADPSVHMQRSRDSAPADLIDAVETLLDRVSDLGIDTVNGPWSNDEMGDCGAAASAVRALLQASVSADERDAQVDS